MSKTSEQDPYDLVIDLENAAISYGMARARGEDDPQRLDDARERLLAYLKEQG